MGIIFTIIIWGFALYKALNQSDALVYWFYLIGGFIAGLYIGGLFV